VEPDEQLLFEEDIVDIVVVVGKVVCCVSGPTEGGVHGLLLLICEHRTLQLRPENMIMRAFECRKEQVFSALFVPFAPLASRAFALVEQNTCSCCVLLQSHDSAGSEVKRCLGRRSPMRSLELQAFFVTQRRTQRQHQPPILRAIVDGSKNTWCAWCAPQATRKTGGSEPQIFVVACGMGFRGFFCGSN